MHAVRQSVRPKHQVLILKCYPRFQKGVAEVKPNPSELSYLLYYASTRRSKVQKVGAFLEKKSGTDVSRGRTGNVQVTLHILRALIDKSPRDLPLYAPYVLRILNLILRSKNLSMVEESVSTFQAFCEHHDAALLTADQEISRNFQDLVKSYATLVEKPPAQGRAPISKSIALKWKTAGLRALKHVTSSEAIGTTPDYLAIIIPVILEALHSESDEWLVHLAEKSNDERESVRRRRMSTVTAQTVESVPEEAAVSTTTADADRQGEEDAGIVALESLKGIYSSSNRPQIRWATSALLDFVVEKPTGRRPDTAKTTSTNRMSRTGNWTTTLVGLVAKETPVQDRFIILITASGALAASPITEDNMSRQLILALVIEWLLGSTINMIGLSVMDVLLTLVQHILVVLQLGGKGANILPHHQPTGIVDIFSSSETSSHDQVTAGVDTQSNQDVSTPSVVRQELLDRLRICIGNLATHVYYSDQIRDIISAILLRLKPPYSSGLAGTAVAIERPDEAAQAIAQSAKLEEDESTDQFFSFGTARVAALNAIRDVIFIANDKGTVTGAGAIGRSRVSVQVWEGTQWLLRDEDKRVRRAYIEALLTWLRLEMSKHDLRVLEETPKSKKGKGATTDNGTTGRDVLRSVSNSSPKTRSRISKSTFLQLLHLAIYDNALEAPEEDSNILLMHLLLTSLVQKLGVNAAKTGLPMIVRLQEDINTTPEINTPKAKVNIGSLVHGYFWALTHVFDFDTTMAGFEIQSEISRRQKAGLWLDAVKVPPQPLNMIVAHGVSAPGSLAPKTTNNETLKPFDHIGSMVSQIAIAYSQSISSPPTSPPLSPGRVFTMPLVSAFTNPKSTDELPLEFREAMMFKWSKESCVAAAEKSLARTVSPHGSRSGTTRSAPNNGLLTAGHTPRDNSPGSGLHSRSRGRIPSAFMPLQTKQLKLPNNDSGPNTPVSDSSNHTGTLRVDDLKRVLAGGALADAFANQGGRASVRTSSPLRNSQTAATDFAADGERLSRSATRPSVISTTSDSIVDAEGFESASEGDVERPLPSPQTPIDSSEIAQQHLAQLGRRPYDPSPQRHSLASERHRDTSLPPTTPTSPSRRSVGRARSASETSTEDPEANARALRGALPSDVVRGNIVKDEGVPPVPPLPEGLVGKTNLAPTNGNHAASAQTSAAPSSAVLVLPPEVSINDMPRADAAVENRPKSVGHAESLGDGSGRGSIRGSYQGSLGRKSLRMGGADKRNTMQALLGSIEVGDVGGKGIGRPPY